MPVGWHIRLPQRDAYEFFASASGTPGPGSRGTLCPSARIVFAFLLQIVEVFEEQQPTGLLGIIELEGHLSWHAR